MARVLENVGTVHNRFAPIGSRGKRADLGPTHPGRLCAQTRRNADTAARDFGIARHGMRSMTAARSEENDRRAIALRILRCLLEVVARRATNGTRSHCARRGAERGVWATPARCSQN